MRLFYLSPLFLSYGVYASSDDMSLPSLDLDVLMGTDIQITSAMKRLQSASETAASVYVLDKDQLVKSGVTSIPQALTLVPGMQVRKIDNNVWAITARATAGRYSSKLLVMIDGQSIYNPSFAGVDWESLNVPIYDIERIEVIRGQGGLLWASNATNGVVNIITKHSEDTRTTKLQFESGSNIDHIISGRVGAGLGEHGSYRLYASDKQSDKSDKSYRGTSSDYGNTTTFGGRSDIYINDDVSLMMQGNYTKVDNGQTVKLSNQETNIAEVSASEYTRDDVRFMTRLDHRLSFDSSQMVQVAYSGLRADTAYNNEKFDIIDIDYQMNTLLGSVQFDWGANYRFNKIGSEDTYYVSSIDDLDYVQQYGGFVQAQFEIIPEKMTFSIGNRTERNDFTGWEHQPMARLMWQPSENHAIWSSISQGVRIPSLVESNSSVVISGQKVTDFIETGNPLIDETYLRAILLGSQDIKAETSVSSELGYRYMQKNWALDWSVFYTEAKNVLALDPELSTSFQEILTSPDPISALNSTTAIANVISNAELVTYGTEAVMSWHITDNISSELGYSYTSYEYDLKEGTLSAIGYDSTMSQWFAKINMGLTANQTLFGLYRIESGDAYDTEDFGTLDVSWSWAFQPNSTLSVTANNLLAGEHLEYGNTSEAFNVPTYVESSFVARLTFDF